jgi:hypothetical protein
VPAGLVALRVEDRVDDQSGLLDRVGDLADPGLDRDHASTSREA